MAEDKKLHRCTHRVNGSVVETEHRHCAEQYKKDGWRVEFADASKADKAELEKADKEHRRRAFEEKGKKTEAEEPEDSKA